MVLLVVEPGQDICVHIIGGVSSRGLPPTFTESWGMALQDSCDFGKSLWVCRALRGSVEKVAEPCGEFVLHAALNAVGVQLPSTNLLWVCLY